MKTLHLRRDSNVEPGAYTVCVRCPMFGECGCRLGKIVESFTVQDFWKKHNNRRNYDIVFGYGTTTCPLISFTFTNSSGKKVTTRPEKVVFKKS